MSVHKVLKGRVFRHFLGLHVHLGGRAHREPITDFNERKPHRAVPLDLQYDGPLELKVDGKHKGCTGEFPEHMRNRHRQVLIADDVLPAFTQMQNLGVAVLVEKKKFYEFVVGHSLFSLLSPGLCPGAVVRRILKYIGALEAVLKRNAKREDNGGCYSGHRISRRKSGA